MNEHSVTQGTVFDVKTGKYIIKYNNGTTATLTKTQLLKILLPMFVEEIPAQEAALAIEAEAKTLANPATGADRVTANEVITPSRTAPTSPPSRIVELRLTSNPVGARVLTPNWSPSSLFLTARGQYGM